MNFPHATAEQWNVAQRMIRGILSRHNVYGSDADDAVQTWTLDVMTQDYRENARCRPCRPPQGRGGGWPDTGSVP